VRSSNTRANYAKYQVLTAIRTHPGCHLRDLGRICQRDFKGIWSLGKVQWIVDDLEGRNKIRSEICIDRGHTCRKLFAL